MTSLFCREPDVLPKLFPLLGWGHAQGQQVLPCSNWATGGRCWTRPVDLRPDKSQPSMVWWVPTNVCHWGHGQHGYSGSGELYCPIADNLNFVQKGMGSSFCSDCVKRNAGELFFQIISLGLTPVIVGEQSNKVPYMNIAWLIPALIGQALTVLKVKVIYISWESPSHIRTLMWLSNRLTHRLLHQAQVQKWTVRTRWHLNPLSKASSNSSSYHLQHQALLSAYW